MGQHRRSMKDVEIECETCITGLQEQIAKLQGQVAIEEEFLNRIRNGRNGVKKLATNTTTTATARHLPHDFTITGYITEVMRERNKPMTITQISKELRHRRVREGKTPLNQLVAGNLSHNKALFERVAHGTYRFKGSA